MEKKSELTVITKTADLWNYIMEVTEKSPKHFRFNMVAQLIQLSMEATKFLFNANDTFVAKGDSYAARQRLSYQREAMSRLKLLAYIAEKSCRRQCITIKAYEQIAKQCTECINLLGAWINSDKKRLTSSSEGDNRGFG